MNKYINHLIETKGFLGLCNRFGQILHRFGFTPKKIDNCLETFIHITNEFGYKPTLCITATLFKNYPNLIHKLNNSKAELALHGFIHTDYKFLSKEKINNHLIKGKEIFKRNKTPLFGFRFPYLSYDQRALDIFGGADFLWSSNSIIYWDILDKYKFKKKNWVKFQRIIKNLYIVKDSSDYLSLPKQEDGYVEIPVSIPDDEILIDRLGIHNEKEIYHIWREILIKTYNRGELFTMQTHHERVPFFKNALKTLLREIQDFSPGIWIATLKEIAEWWKEKKFFNFQITNHDNDYYHIKANCSDKATILVKKSNPSQPASSLFENYYIINDLNFTVKSMKKPFIGVAEDSPPKLINFLREEGFILEKSSTGKNYAIFLENFNNFKEIHKKKLIEIIELSPYPIVRFWRWPHKAKSSMSITGDIDSITIFDFIRRYVLF